MTYKVYNVIWISDNNLKYSLISFS